MRVLQAPYMGTCLRRQEGVPAATFHMGGPKTGRFNRHAPSEQEMGERLSFHILRKRETGGKVDTTPRMGVKRKEV